MNLIKEMLLEAVLVNDQSPGCTEIIIDFWHAHLSGIPPEFVFVPLLTITGGLMGKRGKLKLIDVKEGYEEPAILWTAVIGAKVRVSQCLDQSIVRCGDSIHVATWKVVVRPVYIYVDWQLETIMAVLDTACGEGKLSCVCVYLCVHVSTDTE